MRIVDQVFTSKHVGCCHSSKNVGNPCILEKSRLVILFCKIAAMTCAGESFEWWKTWELTVLS